VSDLHPDMQEGTARPFLNVQELKDTKIEEVKKGGLDPLAVAVLIERAAVTMESLLNVVDTIHAERQTLIAQLDDSSTDKATTTAAGVQAARVLSAAAATAQSVIEEANNEAEGILASIATKRDDLLSEIEGLNITKEELLISHTNELHVSRQNADVELAHLQDRLDSWRADFATRKSEALFALTSVFDDVEKTLAPPIDAEFVSPSEDAPNDTYVDRAAVEETDASGSPIFGIPGSGSLPLED
jgi:hypothetical protein